MNLSEIVDTPIEWYIDLIRTGTPFAFSRWGDGEWSAVLELDDGANCDGHRYFPEMGAELRAILRRRPPYLMTIQSLAVRLHGDRIAEFLRDAGLHDLVWHDSDVFHRAATTTMFHELIHALRQRAVVIVGPGFLRSPLRSLVGYRSFVEVPERDCYLVTKNTIRETVEVLLNVSEPSVVCLSCSMAAEIVLDQLHQVRGDQDTIIDLGSIWDPYAGVLSRSYMRERARLGKPLVY